MTMNRVPFLWLSLGLCAAPTMAQPVQVGQWQLSAGSTGLPAASTMIVCAPSAPQITCIVAALPDSGASAIEMIDSSMMIASVAVRRPMPALYPRRTKPHLTIVNAGR